MHYRIIFILLVFASLLFGQRKGKQEFPWENGGQQKDVIQVPTQYNFSINHRPPINFNIFFDIDETSRDFFIRVSTAVLYDLLQFKKTGGSYQADYQISLAIRDEEETLVKNTWRRTFLLENFKDTNAKNEYDISAYRVAANGTLKPGKYEGWIEIHDLTSRQTFNSRRFVTIPGNEEKTTFTQIAFVMDPDSGYEDIRISPAVSTLEFDKSYAVLMRFLTENPEPAEINLRLYQQKDEVEELFTQEYFNLRPESGMVTMSYTLPTDSMPEGMYKIRVRLENTDLELERSFSVVWFDKPIYLYKSELALKPMRYILSEEEFDKAESLNRKELSEWIHQYWKAKDPTPATDYNEISTLFFERVHQSNQEFGHKYKRGWQTDRGRILILYGQPDKIENNRYSTNKLPHVIWKYANGQDFVFVDKNNDEDFTLLVVD